SGSTAKEDLPDAAPLPAISQMVLDESILADLAPDDPEIVVELIDQFVADAPTRAHAVSVALTQRDALALRQAAHLFKGEAGSIGARELEHALARLESMARTDTIGSGV